jgi:hypothetical protein
MVFYQALALPSLATTTKLLTHPVYIESTDTFGVMYYANYPLLLERSFGQVGSRLVAFNSLKLKVSATLGDEIYCHVSQGKRGNKCSFNSKHDTVVFATATGVETSSCVTIADPESVESALATSGTGGRVHVSAFDLYHDEIDMDKTLAAPKALQTIKTAK